MWFGMRIRQLVAKKVATPLKDLSPFPEFAACVVLSVILPALAGHLGRYETRILLPALLIVMSAAGLFVDQGMRTSRSS
jgi:hypothetical protein